MTSEILRNICFCITFIFPTINKCEKRVLQPLNITWIWTWTYSFPLNILKWTISVTLVNLSIKHSTTIQDVKTLEICTKEFRQHLIITKNIWRVAPTLKYFCNNYVFAIFYKSLFENKFQEKSHFIETSQLVGFFYMS